MQVDLERFGYEVRVARPDRAVHQACLHWDSRLLTPAVLQAVDGVALPTGERGRECLAVMITRYQ